MAFRGHTACWANTGKNHYQPSFIRDETDPVVIENFLEKHVKAVVGRYAGKYHAWDVVNEAINVSSSPATLNDSVWAKVDDFVCKAFRWAHEADPTAQLFYNDYNHASSTGWSKGKSDAVFNLVQDLKNRDCPIHGVGFQLHVDTNFNDQIQGVIDNMKRYEDIGINVHFTEIDVKCSKKDGKCVPWDD